VIVKIYVSATLKGFFGKRESLEVEGKSIREILENISSAYPEAARLYGEDGALLPFVKIYVGNRDYTGHEHWDEGLGESEEMLLLPAIAGGSQRREVISDERRREVALDDREIDRFNKHLMLKEIGVRGQKRIKAAKVAVVGVGALGSSVIQYLAAAGVGTIKIIDFDEVTLGNLQNQVLHTARDVGRPKVASARDKIRNVNRDIKVVDLNMRLDADNVEEALDGVDVVVDCSDNYKARYLVNDACGLKGIPEVFGAIYQYEGQVSVFNFDGGPCYRCQFPSPPPAGLVPSCAEGGSISPLAGIIGSLQANEALKLIVGMGEVLSGRMLVVDSLNLHFRIVQVDKREDCELCCKKPLITQVVDYDYEELCGLKPDDDELPVEGIEASDLADRIERGDDITIVDVREPHERAINRFPDALVIPIGQLARRQKELDPEIDTIFICKEGKRSILAINTLREAGYKGPMYNLIGGVDGARDIIFSHEGAWL
jgi:adenylyltransferase/sulfurtransferase